jgi:hypothetical protein
MYNSLCKDLLANPCREMLAGGLCPPLRKHFKRKLLQSNFKVKLLWRPRERPPATKAQAKRVSPSSAEVSV